MRSALHRQFQPSLCGHKLRAVPSVSGNIHHHVPSATAFLQHKHLMKRVMFVILQCLSSSTHFCVLTYLTHEHVFGQWHKQGRGFGFHLSVWLKILEAISIYGLSFEVNDFLKSGIHRQMLGFFPSDAPNDVFSVWDAFPSPSEMQVNYIQVRPLT